MFISVGKQFFSRNMSSDESQNIAGRCLILETVSEVSLCWKHVEKLGNMSILVRKCFSVSWETNPQQSFLRWKNRERQGYRKMRMRTEEMGSGHHIRVLSKKTRLSLYILTFSKHSQELVVRKIL